MTSADLIAGVLFIALSAGLLAFSLWILGTAIVRRVRHGVAPTVDAFEYDFESESAA